MSQKDPQRPNKQPLLSARLKHPSIELHGNQAHRPLSAVERDVIVMSTLVLDEGKQQLFNWSINLKSVGGWSIYVGVCLESVSAFNQMAWYNLKQGSYFVSSGSGSNYTSDKTSINKKSNERWVNGEKIYFRYNTISRLFQIIKKNIESVETDVWEYQLPPAPTGDHYRPCVSLWKGCTIEFQTLQ